MAVNHLEQLVSEWYEFQGYFVKRNIRVGLLPTGGYETELDIVAFHPGKNHLVHIEPSLDADSWAKREKRFGKKFSAGKIYIPKIFSGFNLPDEIDQQAVFIFASDKNYKEIGGGKVIILKKLLQTIINEIKGKSLESSAIPEQYTVLRSFQYVLEYADMNFQF